MKPVENLSNENKGGVKRLSLLTAIFLLLLILIYAM